MVEKLLRRRPKNFGLRLKNLFLRHGIRLTKRLKKSLKILKINGLMLTIRLLKLEVSGKDSGVRPERA